MKSISKFTTLIATLILFSGLKLDAQRTTYRYRLVPTLGQHIREGINQWQKGREATAMMSSKIQTIREEYFEALKTGAPDLDEKERLYFGALLAKDLNILVDYKLSYWRFDGNPPGNFREIFFGKIDNGIHPKIWHKFESFADKYITNEKVLTGGVLAGGNMRGNMSEVDEEVFNKAMEMSLPEYESYVIARNWIEFERQEFPVEMETGEDRHKEFIIGLINAEQSKAFSIKESEDKYETLKNLIGMNAMNEAFDIIRSSFYVNHENYGFQNSEKLQLIDGAILVSVLKYASTTSPESYLFYQIYLNPIHEFGINKCIKDFDCALARLEEANYCFGKEKVHLITKQISEIEKEGNSEIAKFKEPLTIRYKKIYTPTQAFIPLLAEQDLIGFGKYLCIHNDYVDNKKISFENNLLPYGEEKLKIALDKSLLYYVNMDGKLALTFKRLMDYLEEEDKEKFKNMSYDDVIEKLRNTNPDFSSYWFSELGDGGWNYTKMHNYIIRNKYPEDTLFIFNNMYEEVKVNPATWTSVQNGTHINGIGLGVCRMYRKKTTPNIINVKFFHKGKVTFEYFLEKNTNYLIVKYSENGIEKTMDISHAISSDGLPCIFTSTKK